MGLIKSNTESKVFLPYKEVEMTEFHFPGKDHREEKYSRGSQEHKLPDFIYIDSDKSHREQKPFHGQIRFDKMAEREYSLKLRFFCLALSVLVFLFSFFAFVFFLFFLLLNALTLFQLSAFWKQTQNLWQQLKKLFVCGIGLGFAAVSPAFGFSVIMVYMLLKGSAMEEGWVSKIVKDRFHPEQ
jgi:hypothetical protein